MTPTDDVQRSAGFSSCGRYRYVLERRWGVEPPLVVIGHNPSTADERQDDPTIRRCMGFARRWGHGGLLMLNLCAWRSTDPGGLTLVDDPVGPANDAAIRALVLTAGRVVAAWGALAAKSPAQKVRERPYAVRQLLRPLVDLYAFRLTRDGYPQHPLYLPADVEPFLWQPRKEGR